MPLQQTCMHLTKSHRLIHLFIFTLLIVGAYANTFTVPWHLDDTPNIVKNKYLHLKKLDVQSIKKTFFTNTRQPSKIKERPYRPIPCLTFALNWYMGQDNVFGYHVVNTAIHIITAFFLYLIIGLLYNTPNLASRTRSPHAIALAAALIWALHPIQTQAVTYIVQRMAQLGTLFYLLGMYFYIKGRFAASFKKYGFWAGACMAYLCAISSKENAAMLPLAIILLEITFFDFKKPKRAKTIIGITAFASIVFILLAGAFLFSRDESLFFMAGYQDRPFSMVERLLTQPRIVLFYLSQLFFPVPSRFSIAHDVTLSTSLFSPWYTFMAIFAILFSCGLAYWKKDKNPILSFAVLFFFINHIIESSIIPLELIFEHRNYLPSLFLFWPLADGVWRFTAHYRSKNVYIILTRLAISVLIIGLASATFIRNRAWKDVQTLWRDAMVKAPNQARPLNILATELAWGTNSHHPDRHEMALRLFQKALEKDKSTKTLEAAIIANMASIHFNINNNDKALSLFEKSLQINPNSLLSNYHYAQALLKAGQWKDALHKADYLISREPGHVMYYITKSQALMWDNRFTEALTVLEQAYKISPIHYNVQLYLGVALNRLNHLHRAKRMLEKAFISEVKGSMVYLALIENCIRSNNGQDLEKYLALLFEFFEREQIENRMNALSTQYLSVPLSEHLIYPVIMRRLEKDDG